MQAASNIANEELMLQAVDTARLDPTWFTKEILNIKTTAEDKKKNQKWDMDIWQEEVSESVADIRRYQQGKSTKYNHEGKNKITVRAMHGPGKTFVVASVMHWFHFCFKGLIVCAGPKEKTLKTRLWPAYRKIRARAGEAYSSLMKVDSTKITWCNDEDWVAHIEAASTTENIAGYHEEYMLFIVDEASGVNEEMFPAIEGALSTGTFLVLILIGNPTKNTGTFYDSHKREAVAKNYHQIHVDLSKTTRVPPKWVQEMKDKYGEQSPIFKIRCLGDFADADADQLIALQWLLDGKNREHYQEGSLPKRRISVDAADGGIDESVVTLAEHYQTLMRAMKMTRHSFEPAIAQVKLANVVMNLFDTHCDVNNGDDIVVDSLGVGAGCAGILIEQGYPVVLYKGGEASDDSKQWRNCRVQTWMVTRNELRDGNVVFDEDFLSDADWIDFEAQMLSIKSKEGDESKEDLLTKKEMKALGIPSPDLADSFNMQNATKQPVYKSSIVAQTMGQSASANESW